MQRRHHGEGSGLRRCWCRTLVGTLAIGLLPTMATAIAPASPAEARRDDWEVTETLQFGDVAVGASVEASVWIRNVSGEDREPNINFETGGGGSGIGLSGSTCLPGETIESTSVCRLQYRFSPDDVGQANLHVSVTIDTDVFGVNMFGNGVWTLHVAVPTTLDFGDVDVGTTSAPRPVVVTNTWDQPVQLWVSSEITLGSFGSTTDCAGSLDPGEYCSFSYTFSPDTTGLTEADATIRLNGREFVIDLQGNGVGDGTNLVDPSGTCPPADQAVAAGTSEPTESSELPASSEAPESSEPTTTTTAPACTATTVGSAPSPTDQNTTSPPTSSSTATTQPELVDISIPPEMLTMTTQPELVDISIPPIVLTTTTDPIVIE